MGDVTLECEGISFSYGSNRVLIDVSLELSTGLVGLVGPNGAGKTTLLRILAGIESPSGGALLVNGKAVRSFRERSRLRELAGYLPQNPHWASLTTVDDFLRYSYRLNNRRDNVADAIDLALGQTRIEHFRNRRLGQLSGGEHRRVFLAGAIVHQPSLLILDEPTAGLDPQQRVSFRALIADLSKSRTVITSTHLIEDLAESSDVIHVLHRGVIGWSGTVAAMETAGASQPGMSRLESGYLNVLGA